MKWHIQPLMIVCLLKVLIPIDFIVDCGATNCLIISKLKKSKVIRQSINIAKEGESLVAQTKGNLYTKIETGTTITIKNVRIWDKLYHNLLCEKIRRKWIKSCFYI